MMIAGQILGDHITVDSQIDVSNLQTKGMYGNVIKGVMTLDMLEAVHLVLSSRLNVFKDGHLMSIEELMIAAASNVSNFDTLFEIYSDIRNRGIITHYDWNLGLFYTYPRGIKSTKNVESKKILPISQSEKILSFDELLKDEKLLSKIDYVVIVTERSTLRYYHVEKISIASGHHGLNWEGVPAIGMLVNNSVYFFKKNDKDKLEKLYFGDTNDQYTVLNVFESCYLAEKGMVVVKNTDGETISAEDFKEFSEFIHPNFSRRYSVYKDLRNKSLFVGSGFEYGSDFTVTDDMHHGSTFKFSMLVADDSKPLDLFDISLRCRVSVQSHKMFVYAYGSEDDIQYVKLNWFKL